MKTKAFVITVIVFILSLFVGVVGAQEDDTQPNRAPIIRALGGEVVEIVADATGLTAREILQAVQDGSTMSEIITDNGGDVDAVIAEVEAELIAHIEIAVENERITREAGDTLLENLSDNLDTFFSTTHELNRGGLRNRVQLGVLSIFADAVTEATGLANSEIIQALRDGSTLSDVITDNGGDVDAIISTVIENVTSAVNEHIESGDLTQEQGDIILENLESKLTDWLNGELPQRPNRGQRGNS